MIYRLLADLVTLTHLAFVAFVVLGGLLLFRWPRLTWLHVPAAVWGAFVEFTGRICPLTPLEIRLREAGGELGYSGGFVEQYVLPLLYPADLTTNIQLLLGVVVVVVNVVVYSLLVARHYRRRTDRGAGRD
jgi:hypothetical protein